MMSAPTSTSSLAVHGAMLCGFIWGSLGSRLAAAGAEGTASVLGERITDMSDDAAYHDTVAHYYHPVGTCAMGTGPMAVCDADGRVHGLPNVVVADVSLMPQITRANTNMPAVMIGERIARTL